MQQFERPVQSFLLVLMIYEINKTDQDLSLTQLKI